MKSIFTLFIVPALAGAQVSNSGWPTYGGDAGGQRYSTAKQVNRTNVRKLHTVWTFHTKSISPNKIASFEATPILFRKSIYLSSPDDQVFALDPASGTQRWLYNPDIDKTRDLGIATSRGVAAWSANGPAMDITCNSRVFLGTLDGRLIALDAYTGKRCEDFGVHGSVDLTRGVDYRKGDNYAVTSPPTIVGDVVVVGAAVADNYRVDVERGDVRGFDVRSGKLLWTWEPIPWANRQTPRTGAANTWSVISADTARGLIFLPVSSPSPDYYGGLRPGDDRDADSLVALDAKTGTKVWAFQVVHHDLWDYDLAAEPLLFTFRDRPAVAVATKMGMLFVLDRLTGKPIYPVHERPVPKSDIPGEVVSPTQPFSDLPALSPLTFDLSKPLGLTAEDDRYCRQAIAHLRYEGLYTPPSKQGTLVFAGNIGGVNWGSTAYDPQSGILYANTNRQPFVVKLQARSKIKERNAAVLVMAITLLIVMLICVVSWRTFRYGGLLGCLSVFLILYLYGKPRAHDYLVRSPWIGTGPFASHFGREVGENFGTPYVLLRQPLESQRGFPCGPTPWGTVSAVNLNTGTSAWQTPLGTEVEGLHTGMRSVAGPIVTAGGLLFTAATAEGVLRAFNSETGVELWSGKLPVPAQATPMTYVFGGKQYILIAAGGHSAFGTGHGDSLVAFALNDK